MKRPAYARLLEPAPKAYRERGYHIIIFAGFDAWSIYTFFVAEDGPATGRKNFCLVAPPDTDPRYLRWPVLGRRIIVVACRLAESTLDALIHALRAAKAANHRFYVLNRDDPGCSASALADPELHYRAWFDPEASYAPSARRDRNFPYLRSVFSEEVASFLNRVSMPGRSLIMDAHDQPNLRHPLAILLASGSRYARTVDAMTMLTHRNQIYSNNGVSGRS